MFSFLIIVIFYSRSLIVLYKSTRMKQTRNKQMQLHPQGQNKDLGEAKNFLAFYLTIFFGDRRFVAILL